MHTPFRTIGIISKYSASQLSKPLKRLCAFLLKHNHAIRLEKESAALLPDAEYAPYFASNIAEASDLLIALGGDGTLIRAARSAIVYDVPVLGIHFGRLGFLTDLPQNHFEDHLLPILSGDYLKEKRILLEAHLYRNEEKIAQGTALNDVVLYKGNNIRAIEFDIALPSFFDTHQQADGIIIATPTGSTAYALSGGGPILSPTLDALLMISMFPHTLAHRPLVLESTAQITLTLSCPLPYPAKLVCDGQLSFDLRLNDKIMVQKHHRSLRFIHPKNYNCFQTLKEKLGWQTNL